MSRSYKKTPAGGITKATSEKADKKIWHSRMRSHTRDRLSSGEEDMYPEVLDVSNKWGMAKDGRQYWDKHKNPRKMSDKERGRKTKEQLREAYDWYSK